MTPTLSLRPLSNLLRFPVFLFFLIISFRIHNGFYFIFSDIGTSATQLMMHHKTHKLESRTMPHHHGYTLQNIVVFCAFSRLVTVFYSSSTIPQCTLLSLCTRRRLKQVPTAVVIFFVFIFDLNCSPAERNVSRFRLCSLCTLRCSNFPSSDRLFLQFSHDVFRKLHTYLSDLVKTNKFNSFQFSNLIKGPFDQP